MKVNTTANLKVPWYPWIGKRPFYGWVLVAVGTLTHFTQGLVNNGFATYLGHLQKDFGWSKAILAGPRSITQVENAALGPLEGFLVDRFGPRIVLAIGAFVMGLGLILFGLTQSLWMFFLSNIIITLGNGFQGTLPQSVAINHWFRRKRSMATSVMILGIPISGMIGIPALVFLQSVVGWRNAAILSGLLTWAIGLPLSTLLRRSPEPFGLLPDGDTSDAPASAGVKSRPAVEEYDFTLREAVHSRVFWLLAIGLGANTAGMAAMQTHLFLHLERGVGLSATTTALVWSVASMVNIPARLVGGFLGDRAPKNVIMGTAITVMAASFVFLGLATSLLMAFAFAVLYGISWGPRGVLYNTIPGDYFGRKSQGVIRGWLQLVGVPLTIAAPVVTGYMADLQGNYRLTFIVMSFVMLVGAVLVFLTPPPKAPAGKKFVAP